MKKFKANKTLEGFENSKLTTDEMHQVNGGRRTIVVVIRRKDGSTTIVVVSVP